MDTSSRTSNSIKNILSILIIQISAVVYSLVIKRALLQNFSIELIGVGNLFDTFIGSFNILDAGFSSLLSFYLYKSISENNTVQTREYLSLFKTIYWTIAGIIAAVLILLAPFIYDIFNIAYSNKEIVYIYYFLHLFMTAAGFILLSKITLLTAMQKKYLNSYFVIGIEFVMFCAKMYSIVVLKNFVLYSFFAVLCIVLEYMNANRISNKNYPEYKKIPFAHFKEIKTSGIITKVKRYIYRTVYDIVYYSTDTTIIGIVDTTTSIGYLSNYTMIVSTVSSVFASMLASIQSSLGNMLFKDKNIDNYYFTYETLSLFGFYLSTLLGAGMMLVIDDAIKLLFGMEYIIDFRITIVLIVTLFINNSMRNVENVFSVSGLMFKEKWPLIISALTNLVLSILLYYSIGLIGVYIATFISTIIYWTGKIYHVSNDVFQMEKSRFFRSLARNYAVSIITIAAAWLCFTHMNFAINSFVQLLGYMLLITVFITLLFGILNCRNRYLHYIIRVLKNYRSKVLH